MKESALSQCENVEDFDELLGHLGTITDEDVLDDEKLKSKLNNIFVLYKNDEKEASED